MWIVMSIALIAYTVGIVLAVVATIYRSDAARRGCSAMWLLAWVAHLAGIVAQGLVQGSFPMTNVGEYLLVLGWVVLSLHLYLWFRKQVWMAGLVLPPLAALMLLAAWNLVPDGPVENATRPNGLFIVHTTLSTLGVATLCVAFTMSLMYLAQDRGLKSKRKLELLERLPALDVCDHLGFHAMLVGFVLLSLGIATGVVMNESLHQRLWVPGVKQYLAALAWVVFASVIASRAAFGFRGRKSAYLTIAGFALGLMTVVGMFH